MQYNTIQYFYFGPTSYNILQTDIVIYQCRLTTLETRRICGDQIEVFKIKQAYEWYVFQNKE